MATSIESSSLPVNIEAEQFVLGSIQLDGRSFSATLDLLSPEDFSLEKHRKIFRAMVELHGRGELIDRVSVADELMKNGELESCGGVYGLVSLDDGIPRIVNLDGYVRIVKEKSTLRKTIFVCQKLMGQCLSKTDSPDQVISAGREAFADLSNSLGTAGADHSFTGFLESMGGVSEFFKPKLGIQTQWRLLNEATNGWYGGDLVIIAARPSMGKTAFGLNIAIQTAEAGTPATIYSFEMGRDSIWKRLISYRTGLSYQEIQAGKLNQTERRNCAEASEYLSSLPLYVVDANGKSANWIHADIQRAKREGQLGVSILDYLGLIRTSGDGSNRNQELGEVARNLKGIAREFDIPMIVLAQLNRALEGRTDKKPALSDLRDSGEIEEHADLIGFLFRAEYYNRVDERLRGLAEFIIGKQRNGATPSIPLRFDYRGGKFSSMENPNDDPR